MRVGHQQLEQHLSASKPRRMRNILAGVWGTVFGVLALWSFFGSPSQPVMKHVTATPVIAAVDQTPPAVVQVSAKATPQARFASKAIRDIFPIADRVIAKNPEVQPDEFAESHLVDLSETELAKLETELSELLDNEPLPALIDGIPDDAELLVSNVDEEEDESIGAEPTKSEKLYDELLAAAETLASQSSPLSPELTDYGPFVLEHWRVIHFRLTRPDGDMVRIWLARPTWWLEAERVYLGGHYEFDMEEVGAVGLADVISIDECQQPPRRRNDDHHLVTGKFEHEATNVIDLYIEGQDEPIGTTVNHPFWSENRQAFVEAESLHPGENLLNAEGQRVRVITHSPRPGPQTVFNLEVDGEHVYFVTDQGALVHNGCEKHHFIPMALGNLIRRGHKWLTPLAQKYHARLHRAMEAHLEKFKKTLNGKTITMNYAKHDPADIAVAFSRAERQRALTLFYKAFQGGKHLRKYLLELSRIKGAGKFL